MLKTKKLDANATTDRVENSATLELFGLSICNRSMNLLVADCIQYLQRRRSGSGPSKPLRVFALNPEKVIKSRADDRLRTILQSAEVLIADGIGISLATLLLKGVKVPRIAGADLMPALCEAAARSGLTVYLYGASQRTNELAEAALQKRFPGLIVAGASHGYGDHVRRQEVLHEIDQLAPDMLFLALGSPAQEQWVADNVAALNVGLVQGVGGTFDVLAGTVKRAPLAFRLVGLEWFYRLAAQPTRWRRQIALVHYVAFVLKLRFHMEDRLTR